MSLFNELDSAMLELQRSNITLDTCQSSRADTQRMQASSRARRTDFVCQQQERIVEQDRLIQERMVHDLSELNEINRLLITRYEENSRSSRDRRRYTDQI